MTIKKLASEIAKREGKKSQARIGDIREILGILSDIMFVEENAAENIAYSLFENGRKRFKKKKKA